MGKSEGTFIVQAYIKSEEFDKNNPALENFDEYIFAEKEISDYIILSFSRQDTSSIEEVMLHKNLEMVKFLSPERNSLKAAKEFSKEDWEEIYTSNASVVEYSYKKGLNFKKIIQKKSLTQSSKTNLFNNLVTKYATGVASEGLPFGVIARNKRAEFTDKISNLYDLKEESLSFLKNDSTELLICIVKGFKPKGDDNRPDRGVLPFLTMLTSDKYEILSYIYGPMSKNSIDLFRNNFEQLAKQSGFWNVFLSMSDAILLDVPILKDTQDNTVAFQITQDFKNKQLSTLERSPIKFNKISIIPNSVHEDDVDSAIHTLFTSLPENICFESSCNPPGGDWSGISIRHNDYVYRWLSLPRAPKMVKRPDHILELSAGSKMYLLIIESKDYPNDILREGDLNKGLKDYLKRLIEFPPSAIYSEHDQKWKPNNDYDFLVSIENFQMISAAAYINKSNIDFSDRIFESSKCDMLFILLQYKRRMMSIGN